MVRMSNNIYYEVMSEIWEEIRDIMSQLTHLGLTLFYESPPGAIREIEGFATHICVTREMGAVLHDAYMRHQAKMS